MEKTKRLRERKNCLYLGSPFMYPMEYRWMSVDTPVTNRIIVTESGSTSSDVLTLKPPDSIHVKIDLVTARSSASRPSRAKNVTALAANAPAVATVAIQPATGSRR